MSSTAKKLRDDAMALPEEERELLAAELLDSLVPDPDWEQAWAQECERRLEDVRAGRVQTTPWSAVEASLRARLARGDDPGCHWDCFGYYACEGARVVRYTNAPVPCSEWTGRCPLTPG